MDTETFLRAINSDVVRFEQAMGDDLTALREQVDPNLFAVLEYGLRNGGKRIRPLLVMLSARLCGCRDEEVCRLALAFEYLHAATLFHDDVIDNADTRRGRPSVNKQFSQVAAILAGDFLHARSMRLVGQLVGNRGLEIFCGATSGMVNGEFLQLHNSTRQTLSEQEYFQIVMAKTGFLITAACEIGALYAGGSREQQQALHRYGEGLGVAFQMVDDLLDYLGESGKTGKSVGNDLDEGKLTLPVILALQRGSHDDIERLRQIFSLTDDRCAHLAEVISLVQRYHGFEDTRRRAEDAVRVAVEQLAIFANGAGNAGDREILAAVAEYILSREK